MRFGEWPGRSGGDGKDYLRIQDGQEVTGVFRGEPILVAKHWDKQNFKGICKGEGCELCAQGGTKLKERFRINFITKEDGNYVAKVCEQGKPFWHQLDKLAKKFDPLDRCLVEISRTGSGLETKYTILPAKEWQVNEALEAKLRAVKLQDLRAEESTETSGVVSDDSDDEVPF